MAATMKKNVELYDEALKIAREQPDRVEAILRKLEEASSAGDARATYALGSWYCHGKNVEKDIRRANELFAQAAKSGNADAQFDLANSYEMAAGVDKDERKALLLYIQSALGGNAQAAYEVGRCYCYGIGTKKDDEVGDIWLQHAGRRGVTD